MSQFYRSFRNMCWPAPGADLGDLSHKLTYGEPTKSDLLVCASVINAYQHLVRLSVANRAGIVRELRLGPNGPGVPNVAVTDAARMDWLCERTVNVRAPLPYGSRDMFWASPTDDDSGHTPSNLRALIDKALIASAPTESK